METFANPQLRISTVVCGVQPKLVIRALGGKYNLHFCECLINGIHSFNFLSPPPTVEVDCLLLGCNGIIHEFELDSARFCGCYNYYISDIARRHADEMSGVEVETI